MIRGCGKRPNTVLILADGGLRATFLAMPVRSRAYSRPRLAMQAKLAHDPNKKCVNLGETSKSRTG